MAITFAIIDLLSLTLDHTLNFQATQNSNVPVPAWLNTTAAIQDQIFSKTAETLSYDARLTDEELATLIAIILSHTWVEFNDTDYLDTSAYCWVEKFEAQYDGDSNSTKPWSVSIQIVLIDVGGQG